MFMRYKIWALLLLCGLSVAASGQQTNTPNKKTRSHQPKSAVTDPPPPSVEVMTDVPPAPPEIEMIDPPPAPPKAGWEKVDQMPEFPGGQRALMSYLSRTLEYPQKAIADGVEGKVLVEFVVCENGALCEEKVVRSLGSGCDEEVLRVVKKMPKWEPARKDGKPVKTIYRLPVQFKFAEEVPQEKK